MPDERHLSLAAELLSGLGTNRELAEILNKSPGTIGDWKSGRRRPPREVMAAIAARWPQVPVEFWAAPPLAVAAESEAAPAMPHAGPPPPPPTATAAPEGEMVATTAAELYEVIQRDLARLRGAEGGRLEIGKRSEVIRRMVACQVALTKSTGQGEITEEQVTSSAAWGELLDALEADLREAFAAWPEVIWGIGASFAAWRRGDETPAERARRHVHMGVGLRAGIARLLDPVGATSRAEAELAHRLLGLASVGAAPSAASATARDEAARIVAHPEFQRVVRLVTEAIAPYPEALAAATAVLESVEG